MTPFLHLRDYKFSKFLSKILLTLSLFLLTGLLALAQPVITTQPVTQTVCPNTGQPVTFSVVATGTGLTYEWYKDGGIIADENSPSYTIEEVVPTDRGKFYVVVTGTDESEGSVTSSVAFLNTTIIVQPSVPFQRIATGNSITLTVIADNATGYQWKKNDVNIPGATSSTYTINPVVLSDDGDYKANAINSENGGCASLVTNVVTITPSVNLFSKSTGALNSVSTWGANTDGSGNGSNPVDFSRAEHTFNIANRTTASTLTDLTIAGRLNIGNGVVLTVTPNTLFTAGRITRSGTGSIAGSSTSNITLAGVSALYFQTGNQTLKNLTITGGTVTLNTALNITAGSTAGTLTVSGGTFNTGNLLVLKSDPNGSASVGSSAGTISGMVTVERYFGGLSNRAFRQITPGVNGGSIRDNWQEGLNNTTTATNLIGTVGYGTHVTGSQTGANGFDATQTGQSSVYTLSTGGTAWEAIANTTGINIDAKKGYLVFIRGDRTANLNSNYSNGNTTLRNKGTLLTGNQTYTVTAGKYNFITNPYASSIGWKKIYDGNGGATALANNYVYYDPHVNTRGAYVTVQTDGTVSNGSTSYDLNALNIQSGQAFWVYPNAGSSVIIHEADKTAIDSRIVFRTNDGTTERFAVSLYFKGADSVRRLADGLVAKFNNDYFTAASAEDAIKFTNFDEDIAILRDNKKLSIEGRPLIEHADTLPLFIAKMKVQGYEWQFDPSDFDAPGLQAYLQDKFLSIETPISISSQTKIPFTITSNTASSATDRFKVVFRTAGVLPINFTDVKAYEKNNNIQVEWNLGNESNINKYEIEKSVDGRTFTKAGMQAVRTISNTTESYNWLDVTPNNGDNFYRIKAIEQSGQYKYSQVVNVKTGKGQRGISIYPNPVKGNVMSLQFVNQPQGKYAIQLYNNLGQEVYRSEFNHAGGSSTQTLQLNSQVVKGIYQLQVSNGENKITQKVIVE